MTDDEPYVGLTKRELIKLLANIPDDAPIYRSDYGGCFGIHKLKGVDYVGDPDYQDYTKLPFGLVMLDFAEDGYEVGLPGLGPLYGIPYFQERNPTEGPE